MTTQLELNDYAQRLETHGHEPSRDICARKHGGNVNSVAANKRAPKKKDMQRVLELIKAAPDGLTCKEACHIMGKSMNQISGRFSWLCHEDGLIHQDGRRDGCGVWFIVTQYK